MTIDWDKPTKELLHDLLLYRDGVFTWKERSLKYFSEESAMNVWNAQNAGNKIGTKSGNYLVMMLGNRKQYVHRMVFLYFHGYTPLLIDHKNQNSFDNRIENLQEANERINGKNCKMFSTNTSGFTGVTYDKSRNQWIAQIRADGKNIKLGRFKEFEDAVSARKDANIRYGFSQYHGQKPLYPLIKDPDF